MPLARLARTALTTLALSALLAIFHVAPARAADPAPTNITSPDGKIVLHFHVDTGAPAYSVTYNSKPVLLDSKLGFEPAFTTDFTIQHVATAENATEWTNKFGERRNVPDHYRQLDVDLKHSSGKLLRITFRAYDEGIALRYSFPAQNTHAFAFDGEHTEFQFPADTLGYEEHGTEGDYSRVPIAAIKPWCERPLTLEFPAGFYASLNEAGNLAYPRMLLSAIPGTPAGLISALGGPTSNTAKGGDNDGRIQLAAGDSTPWRFLLLGDRPGDLLERNYLLLNLNRPSVLQDDTWIRPGKAMRDGALSTTSAKAIIDLAPKLGLDYVGFDDHWFGPNDSGDATHIRVPALDIAEVAAYGKQHHIGVCVYVDARQINLQRDALFALFDTWGVTAMKIGFVAVGSQKDTTWITDIVSKAADHHMLLDLHDGYRATGISRTYPHLLAVEGVQGNEHHPSPAHNCTLPFTRYPGGIGDYTPCYLDHRIQTTHAHQLALGVVCFSPLQWLYWYDKPAQLQNVPPEAEFWVHMPTVWDSTKVINGSIGEYATIARQSGTSWFVGTINNSDPRTLKIPLSFLTPGTPYLAHLYGDDPKVQTATKVGVQTQPVDSTTVLDATLVAGGGQALWIEPAPR